MIRSLLQIVNASGINMSKMISTLEYVSMKINIHELNAIKHHLVLALNILELHVFVKS